ncbi:hypothetical protein DL770_002023 [Monosporascus sp. CRB-9-2]|nr:hypothetical protein DL770_002023 [Monosporascus sp. CRB-9-2]
MSPEAFLRSALRVLVPLAVAFTGYLYLYPAFLGCAFPLPPQSSDHHHHQTVETDDAAAFQETLRQHAFGSMRAAPFRLLALGDPQLEGDTSIRNYGREPFPHLSEVIKHLSLKNRNSSLRIQVRSAVHDLVDFFFDDIPDFLESTRKRIDLVGNDFFLGHIYRTLHWWAKPTHVTVLGDLLGSQWISDDEFERRSWRYWNRSFRGGERVPDDVAAYPREEYDLAGLLGVEDSSAASWRRRIINIAGNHDIGYAGDLTRARLERFERVFGKAAYELRFELPIANATTNATIFDPDKNPESDRLPPELRIVVVNNMNLDTPAVEQELQDKTYAFVNDVISTASAVEFKGHFTMVLTHIPLYKPAGTCVDPPYFTFHVGGGVKEQNQLSADASRGFLEGIYGLSGDANAPAAGMGRRGVVLNGHDHEGCDVWHYIDQGEPAGERQWRAAPWGDARSGGLAGRPGAPGLREITVRSMMADFGGSAGLLSAWFDEAAWEWRFEFATCALGRQYYWWFVHVYDLIVLGALLVYGALKIALAAGCGVDRWPNMGRRAPKEKARGRPRAREANGEPKTVSAVYEGNGDAKKG